MPSKEIKDRYEGCYAGYKLLKIGRLWYGFNVEPYRTLKERIKKKDFDFKDKTKEGVKNQISAPYFATLK